MKARWQKAAARFAALQQREKMLVAVATMVAIGFVGFSAWVDPALAQATRLRKQMAQQRDERATLQAQVDMLKTQQRDPDSGNRSALAELQQRLAAVNDQIAGLDGVLVPPERVPGLLQALLSRHRGLSLVSLQTLPPVPLIPPVIDAKTDGKRDEAPAPGGNIYRHGIEIRVAGSYGDLLAYVAELENSPQRLIWDRLALTVIGYPRSELSLTVFTLSLAPDWLVV